MFDRSDVEQMRPLLARACRTPDRRVNFPEIDIPHRWQPAVVQDPATLASFTPLGAWEFIAECLEGGAPIRYKPPSALFEDHAYEMIEFPEGRGRRIYMKIALKEGFGKLIGVSFHYERT